MLPTKMQGLIKKTLLSFLLFLSVFSFAEETKQEDVSEYLDALGRSLKKKLTHPGEGHEDLLKDLFDYYNHLEAIHATVSSSDDQIKQEGYNLVQEIIESGGPPHLNIEVDFDEFLFKVYKNDRDVQTIHNVLKDNRKMWDKLKEMYERHSQI